MLSSIFDNVFLCSIFHTVLFHRSYGKFTYHDDSSYIIGTIGYEDVDCDYIGGECLKLPNFDFL